MKLNLPFLAIVGLLGYAVYKTAFEGPVGAEPSYITDASVAVSRAKQQGKPLVLIFSASWCGPCKQMKKEVYPSEEVAPFHQKFVWAYADVDDPANQALAKQYNVTGIPHVQFLGADGASRGELVGGVSPSRFAAALATVLAN
jgi:thiol:disulfide interchange protein